MQILIQSFHDVGEGVNVNNFRLKAQEVSEVFQIGKVFRITNAAAFLGRD